MRRKRRSETLTRGLGVVALLATLLAGAHPAGAAAVIGSRGAATRATWASESTRLLVVTPPATAQVGDVLVASLGFGRSGSSVQPTLTPPAGWALVSRINQGAIGTLAAFSHAFVAGETSYTFTTDTNVGGVGFVAAFSGVDTANRVDAAAGQAVGQGTTVATPSVTTTLAGDMLVAGYFGYRGGGSSSTSWAPPSGLAELGDVTNTSGSRTGSLDAGVQAAPGASGAKSATASARLDYGLGILVALRPAGTGPTLAPVISGLAASAVTATGATIGWATDQPADGQVSYGTTTAYGATTPRNGALVTNHAQLLSGLAPNTTYHARVTSANSSGQTSTSGDITFRTAAPPPPSGATPLLVDTDLFSDADDAGALAVAFALQVRGEADVIGIGINTRTNRPAVATDSWKCAAAIAQFYGDPDVPIGTSLPNNGTAVNTIDFIRPCAQRASATTRVPGSAVTMYRRALAAQPDSSVVVASAGYLGNLAALLDSPADAISPLSGRDLVARKVRSLVVMGGGFPSRSQENNLAGDPAAAQRVASGWPTKLVWSGYEVGDAVHTGDTITAWHPVTSPVRIAYEAFVGPSKWIYSYDLTAVYHAVRPTDPVFGEIGPGTNVVNASGGNVFTAGAGNQYYLRLANATTADTSIETLLDTLPGVAPPPPSTSGPSDDFSTNTIDPARWTVGGSGSVVAAVNAQLQMTHNAGAWTTGSLQSVSPHDQTGRSLQVRLRRAANAGLGGSTFGETSIRLQLDSTHFAEFFVASGALTAWANPGTGAVNLTPNWPAYSAAAMQWLRFREAGGRLYFEYAAGSTTPGTWQALGSTPDPFAMSAVRLAIIAGSSTSVTDVAQFDDIALS